MGKRIGLSDAEWKIVGGLLLAEMVKRDGSADMIDSTVMRTDQCAVGIRSTGPAEALGRLRGGSTTKLHARCDAQGRPLAFVLAPERAHDVWSFRPLMRIVGDWSGALLAGKGDETNAIRKELADARGEAAIPAESNCRQGAIRPCEVALAQLDRVAL